MSVTQPYRIGTTYKTHPGSNVGAILATTHGPTRARRLTVRIDQSQSADANHERAALTLARKITQNTDATVALHSMNDSGTRRDWEVIA